MLADQGSPVLVAGTVTDDDGAEAPELTPTTVELEASVLPVDATVVVLAKEGDVTEVGTPVVVVEPPCEGEVTVVATSVVVVLAKEGDVTEVGT